MKDVLTQLMESSSSCCLATLVQVKGSAPQDVGAKILIQKNGNFFGTIGGGKFENFVISKAIELINGHENTSFLTLNLQRDIKMTCGGEVSVYFECFHKNDWNVCVFGAGHVSQKLVGLLSQLNCHVTVVDSRKEWLSKAVDAPNVKKVLLDNMEDYVSELCPNTFVVIMTMGHGTDVPILNKIIELNREFPFLGVIGSKSKRNSIEKELNSKLNFICPLGHPIGDNSPGEISVSILSQLIEFKDKVFKTAKRQT